MIEMDELNQHETMTTLLSLIHHMRNKKIYNPPTTPVTPPPGATGGLSGDSSFTGTLGLSQSTPVALPSWMVYLQKKMSSRNTHLNIKLFIAKLIINEPKVYTICSCLSISCFFLVPFLFYKSKLYD